MNPNQVKKYLGLLKKYYNIAKCRKCDCFQEGLRIIRLEVNNLKPIDKDKLLDELNQCIIKSNIHKCLGCKPCEPAYVIANFMKNKAQLMV